MTAKKILIITRNLPPLIGGMERLNWHIADELSNKYNVLILSHTKAKSIAPKKCSFYGVPLNPLPLFLILAFFKTFLICLIQKPDVIFAGSGLTAPIVVFWAKIFRKKSIVYIHGLDIATNHPVYNRIWIPMIRMADKVIANSTPTLGICVSKGVPHDKLSIIHPGVTFPPIKKDQELINSIKNQYNLNNKKVLLSVGRLTERKGIREFVDLSLPKIIQTCSDTILVIIGDTPIHSLNKNLQSKNSIISMGEKHGIQKNILFIGNISDDELLATWYYLADIHVFPVKHIPSDPEGFGMVAIEAAAHGTPTIAFATGGVIDAINNSISGYLIEPNNYYLLAEKILIILKQPIKHNLTTGFAENFSWKNLNKKLVLNIQSLQKTLVNTHPSLIRQAHAVIDLNSRIPKAKKIELLLKLDKVATNHPLRILEIGCGSGGIAHYFATHETIPCKVDAVDIYDNRQVFDHYTFTKVAGTTLPFDDQTFDVVITNHVIEHVGEEVEQLHHLSEIKRVLKQDGQCYLAVPNRWMLTEPHYKLKFLSWWPHAWRTPYLKLMGKGSFYDCEPFEMHQLERILKKTGFKFTNLSVAATKATFAIQKPNTFITKLILKIPNSVLGLFKIIIPTLIYKLKHHGN